MRTSYLLTAANTWLSSWLLPTSCATRHFSPGAYRVAGWLLPQIVSNALARGFSVIPLPLEASALSNIPHQVAPLLSGTGWKLPAPPCLTLYRDTRQGHRHTVARLTLSVEQRGHLATVSKGTGSGPALAVVPSYVPIPV